jgi:hypothetical protein
MQTSSSKLTPHSRLLRGASVAGVPVATDPQATASPSMISFDHGGSDVWVVVQRIAKLTFTRLRNVFSFWQF